MGGGTGEFKDLGAGRDLTDSEKAQSVGMAKTQGKDAAGI